MKRSYIGVTGFTSNHEVMTVLGALPPRHSHQLMVGVLASSLTLSGKPHKFPGRSPNVDEIENIFIGHESCLNLIHYNTADRETLFDQLQRMHEIGGVYLDGFQLNIAWPDPKVVERAHRELRSKSPTADEGMTIVLQVGNGAMKKIGDDPLTFVKRVGEYYGNIDYILLDPSGGEGKPLDTARARELLFALREAHSSWLRFGVAGGLGPDSLDLIQPLLSEFADLSIDAEGKLRDPPQDRLNTSRTKKFVSESAKLFSSAQLS